MAWREMAACPRPCVYSAADLSSGLPGNVSELRGSRRPRDRAEPRRAGRWLAVSSGKICLGGLRLSGGRAGRACLWWWWCAVYSAAIKKIFGVFFCWAQQHGAAAACRNNDLPPLDKTSSLVKAHSSFFFFFLHLPHRTRCGERTGRRRSAGAITRRTLRSHPTATRCALAAGLPSMWDILKATNGMFRTGWALPGHPCTPCSTPSPRG